MSLDAHVAKAQHTLAVIQRALHGTEPWTATWGGQEAPVTIERADHGIALLASFEDAPTDEPSAIVGVYSGSDLILVHHRDDAGCRCDPACGFDLRWEINLKVPVAG